MLENPSSVTAVVTEPTMLPMWAYMLCQLLPVVLAFVASMKVRGMDKRASQCMKRIKRKTRNAIARK